MEPNDAQRPLLSVVKGEPSEEELAALTLAVLSRRGGADPGAGPPRAGDRTRRPRRRRARAVSR
ncbi:acyl-CoA carboxylase subunit epsilon [Rothia sp. AR01]|uniref:Acyl-CoA carboxylase subunit epsilon n=1 Tax=Rothia santali TaxID=2949643 RepID=A0A9X2HIY7_9MICC|nr:acyl-CoA carboxylase subunit epsilon [Rothia santali]MCP3425113.1 acyl-CoA carboxylase subunit epsilon [Rothia santali]